MGLSIPNPIDQDNCLSAAQAKEYIDSNDISFDRLKQMMPDVKTDTREKKTMQALKKHDEGQSFKANKLRATVGYDECGAERCIYSVYAVGAKSGPRQSQLDSLLGSL